MKKKAVLGLGSVSHATMRAEDLIPCFLAACDGLRLSKGERATVRDIRKRSRVAGYYEGEDSACDLESLFDALGARVPDFCYFGAHEGDGSDYGVWVSWDSLEDDGDVLRVGDLLEVESGYAGHVLVSNERGNATLYRRGRNGRLYELWACV